MKKIRLFGIYIEISPLGRNVIKKRLNENQSE